MSGITVNQNAPKAVDDNQINQTTQQQADTAAQQISRMPPDQAAQALAAETERLVAQDPDAGQYLLEKLAKDSPDQLAAALSCTDLLNDDQLSTVSQNLGLAFDSLTQEQKDRFLTSVQDVAMSAQVISEDRSDYQYGSSYSNTGMLDTELLMKDQQQSNNVAGYQLLNPNSIAVTNPNALLDVLSSSGSTGLSDVANQVRSDYRIPTNTSGTTNVSNTAQLKEDLINLPAREAALRLEQTIQTNPVVGAQMVQELATENPNELAAILACSTGLDESSQQAIANSINTAYNGMTNEQKTAFTEALSETAVIAGVVRDSGGASADTMNTFNLISGYPGNFGEDSARFANVNFMSSPSSAASANPSALTNIINLTGNDNLTVGVFKGITDTINNGGLATPQIGGTSLATSAGMGLATLYNHGDNSTLINETFINPSQLDGANTLSKFFEITIFNSHFPDHAKNALMDKLSGIAEQSRADYAAATTDDRRDAIVRELGFLSGAIMDGFDQATESRANQEKGLKSLVELALKFLPIGKEVSEFLIPENAPFSSAIRDQLGSIINDGVTSGAVDALIADIGNVSGGTSSENLLSFLYTTLTAGILSDVQTSSTSPQAARDRIGELLTIFVGGANAINQTG